MKRMTLKITILVSAVVGIGLASDLPDTLFAAIEDKHCCNPAHAEDPPAPAGSATDCEWDEDDQKCVSKDGYCSGSAYETAVPGKCCTPLVEGNTCNDNYGKTFVTVSFGTWVCDGDATGCSCVWTDQNLGNKQIEVTQCSGSTCAANPTCP